MSRNKPVVLALIAAIALFSFADRLAAQSSGGAKEDDEKGFTASESVEGSSNSFGQVIKLNSSVGYNFNKYFGADVGLPVYFVRASSTTAGTRSSNGIGNVYADLRLRFDNPLVNFSSTLTGAAPTGDTTSGRSTGRATFDWDNRFDRSFGRLTPFVDLGIANTISDTHFFQRPFTSLGFVSHYEAGAELKFWRAFSVGASAYDVLPSGQQKIFSRIVPRQTSSTTTTTRHGRVFETAGQTTGSADLARDNGFSTWLDFTPLPFLGLELGYSRSVHFRLDTVSFGARFNLRSMFRRPSGP